MDKPGLNFAGGLLSFGLFVLYAAIWAVVAFESYLILVDLPDIDSLPMSHLLDTIGLGLFGLLLIPPYNVAFYLWTVVFGGGFLFWLRRSSQALSKLILQTALAQAVIAIPASYVVFFVCDRSFNNGANAILRVALCCAGAAFIAAVASGAAVGSLYRRLYKRQAAPV